MDKHPPVSAKTRAPRPGAPGGHWRRWMVWLVSAGLFLMVLGVFLPCVRNGFLDYDDARYVTENPNVRSGFNWAAARWAFGSLEAANWHPLTWLSHALDCQIFGMRPWGHHLTSVLLHCANAVLLFLALHRLTGALWRCAFVAALFGLHPLHVESVAWVAERKDVLSTAFWMLTLLAYARYTENLKSQISNFRLSYALALLFFALGLMCKPMLVTLPCVLLLLDYWPLARWRNGARLRLLLEKAPFFLLSAVSCAVTFLAQNAGGAVAEMASLSAGQRLDNALAAYARYLGKLFWPVDLCVFYPPRNHWPAALVLGAAALLGGISVFVFVMRRRFPWLLTGWCWFAGTLAPVIGIVQIGEQSMADRYTYVPFIGLLIALTWTVHCCLRNAAAACLGAAAVLTACGVLTSEQIRLWKDTRTLFQHALAVAPDNYLARFQLGSDALRQTGREQEAIEQFGEAIRLRPDYVPARNNLGLALEQAGREDQAINQYKEAIRIDPRCFEARVNLGVALEKLNRNDEAIDCFQQAVRLQPGRAPAHVDLAVALEDSGRLDEAIGQLQEALRLDPSAPEAYVKYGIALEGKGQCEEGLRQFDHALRLRPGDPGAHTCRGKALLLLKRFDEAVSEFQTVIALEPASTDARRDLDLALQLKAAAAQPAPAAR